MERLVFWYSTAQTIFTLSIILAFCTGCLLFIELCSTLQFFPEEIIKRIAKAFAVSLIIVIASAYTLRQIKQQAMMDNGRLSCEKFRQFVVIIDNEKLKAQWFDLCGEATPIEKSEN